MAGTSGNNGRIAHVCEVCLKSTCTLSKHLKRKCMKNSSQVEIKAAVRQAKEFTSQHLRHGRVFKYEDLQRKFDEENIVKVIQLLVSSGSFVSGQPNKDFVVYPLKRTSTEHPIEVGTEKEDAELHQMCKKRRIEASNSTIHKYHVIFKVVEKDFLNAMTSAKLNKDFTSKQLMLVVSYLEALLLLKHVMKPQIINAFLVTDWLERKHHRTMSGKRYAIIEINSEKYALSHIEEMWFQEYFSIVRPNTLNSQKDWVNCDKRDKFFLSSKISQAFKYNPAKHVKSLFKKYKVPNMKRKDVLKTFKNAIPLLGDKERDVAYAFLASVSNKHPCSQLTIEDLCLTTEILDKLANYPLENSDGMQNQGDQAYDSYHNKEMDEAAALQALLESFPVTINGKPPSIKARESVAGVHERYCYRKWRLMQRDMRKKETLKYFTRRQPSTQMITLHFQKMEWSKNIPTPEEVISSWHPVLKEKSKEELAFMLENQSWRGLHVSYDEEKGKKVIATQTFKKGDVICDYHGMLIPGEEGKKMMKVMDDEMGYLFFFQEPSGKKWCIDAKTVPCTCHPMLETIGRLINHSKKKFNIQPNRVKLDIFGMSQFVILFTALRDIDVEEELLFDYGVTTKSFGGEGADLEWLDHS